MPFAAAMATPVSPDFTVYVDPIFALRASRTFTIGKTAALLLGPGLRKEMSFGSFESEVVVSVEVLDVVVDGSEFVVLVVCSVVVESSGDDEPVVDDGPESVVLADSVVIVVGLSGEEEDVSEFDAIDVSVEVIVEEALDVVEVPGSCVTEEVTKVVVVVSLDELADVEDEEEVTDDGPGSVPDVVVEVSETVDIVVEDNIEALDIVSEVDSTDVVEELDIEDSVETSDAVDVDVVDSGELSEELIVVDVIGESVSESDDSAEELGVVDVVEDDNVEDTEVADVAVVVEVMDIVEEVILADPDAAAGTFRTCPI